MGPSGTPWTIHLKQRGMGYTTMWPELEQRGLPMFGYPAYPGTDVNGKRGVVVKYDPPLPGPAWTGALGTGDHTHDSTRAGGGVGGVGRGADGVGPGRDSSPRHSTHFDPLISLANTVSDLVSHRSFLTNQNDPVQIQIELYLVHF